MKYSVKRPQMDVRTLVPCPQCEACPMCSGMHLVTTEERARYMRESGLPPSAACDLKGPKDD